MSEGNLERLIREARDVSATLNDQATEVLLHETFNGLPMHSSAVAQKLSVASSAIGELCDALEACQRENEEMRQFLQQANVAGRSFAHYYEEWSRNR